MPYDLAAVLRCSLYVLGSRPSEPKRLAQVMRPESVLLDFTGTSPGLHRDFAGRYILLALVLLIPGRAPTAGTGRTFIP